LITTGNNTNPNPGEMQMRIKHLLHNPKHNSKKIDYVITTPIPTYTEKIGLDTGLLKLPKFTDDDFTEAKT
jgi:hypothetical protein